MDTTSLLLSMLFGTIGLGFFMYGKKAVRIVPMLSGVSLMFCPYFISSNIILTLVCLGIVAAPFILRDA